MSFIDHKEKVFTTITELPRTSSRKRRASNTLSFISTSTDPRAWSLDTSCQREYLLDAFQGNLSVKNSVSECSSSGSSSSSAKSTRTNRVKKFRKKQKDLGKKCKSVFSLAENGSIKLLEAFGSVNKTNEKIKELASEKEKLQESAEMAKEEVENLRKLIRDVQDELSETRTLKLENLKLRSELNVDLKNQFLEAQDEINYLSSQLDIFKKYQTEYSELKKSYNQLKEENHSLNMSLVKYSSDNSGLKREIEEYKGNTCREIYASNAIVDRDVLRERIQMRDEKINFLVSFLEEQEITINDLAFQLERLTSSMAAKEMLISNHMNALKCTLDEKNARIIYLEDKLHTSELLITELENLKEQLRLANAMLNENILNYRAQFCSVVSCSEKLLAVRDNYEKELTDREDTIKKLSIFPQSPKTVVYLSQIQHILKRSEESTSDDTETIFSYVPSIRRIIEDMKLDLWNQDSVNSIVDLNSTVTQTEHFIRESFTQYELRFYVSNKYAEANLPDKFYFENQNLKNDISEMSRSLAHLEDAYFTKNALNKELEKKLITCIDEKTAREKELEVMQKELELSKEKLMVLNGELEYNDSLLKKALNEIEIEQSIQESTSDLLSASLDSTLHEYTTYVDALEAYIARKEEKIECLQNYVNHEIQSKANIQDEYTSRLELEIKRITETNIKEKLSIQELQKQVVTLKKQLSDKKNKFKVIQDKLEMAERLFEQINKLDNSCLPQETCGVDGREDIEVDQIVVHTSNKILLYGQRLEGHWKEELSIKEKLLNETFTQKYVENMQKSNRMKLKKLKIKINELKNDVIKRKKDINKAKRSIKDSNLKIHNYKLLINELKSNFEKLLEERNSTTIQLNNKIKEISDLNVKLSARDKNCETLKLEKEKMEKVLFKIIGNLQQSMSVHDKESIGTITDVDRADEVRIKNLTSKNNELSAVIKELQERLDSLLYVPQKEKNSTDKDLLTVSVQTNMDFEKEKQEEIECYKNMVKKLEYDLEKERQSSEKVKTENSETYRKELKTIMKMVQENILKLEEENDREISRLKSIHEEEHKTIIGKHETQVNELGKQIMNYEKMLASKDEELNKGINELRVEIRNIIAKKEESISKIKDVTNIHINYLKNKYKKNIRKVKNELKLAVMKHNELKEITEKKDVGSQMDQVTPESVTKSDKVTQTFFNCGNYSRSVQCSITSTKENAESQTKVVKIDVEVNTDECSFASEKVNQRIPEKVDHIIFGLPPNKNFDINFKESIKCSIKETKSAYIGDIFKGFVEFGGSGDAPVRDICLQRNKNELISHIEQIENELLQKTEDYNRNVLIYQETIRKQKSKIRELENSINQETLQTYHLQHRLGMEFSRAEQFLAEKNELQEYVEALQKYIQDHEIESHSEREKYNHLKKRFDSVLYQRKHSDQLEESLKRLKEKLETAVAYEKKLTEEIQEEIKGKEKNNDVFEYNDNSKTKYIESSKELAEKDEIDNSKQQENNTVSKMNKSDLKVVFIQQCEFRRLWSRQILERKHHA